MFVAPRRSDANEIADGWNEGLWQMVEAIFAAAAAKHAHMRGRQKIFTAAYIGRLDTCVGLWLNGTIELGDLLLRQAVYQFQNGIYA